MGGRRSAGRRQHRVGPAGGPGSGPHSWNLEPRGPHVTPSFYFGFTNDLLPVVVPWLQLNSLGLTILLHPNTHDPRADHLHYALWVNRAQPVNGYGLPSHVRDEQVEQIFPNVTPTVRPETA